MMKKYSGSPCIFASNDIGFTKGTKCSECNILEITDGRRDDKKHILIRGKDKIFLEF